MSKILSQNGVDLGLFLFRIRQHWYYYIILLVISTSFAYYKNLKARKLYKFNANILMGNKQTGPKGAGELLNVIEALDRKTIISDQKKILSSFSMVKQALLEMDMLVSYYERGDLNTYNVYKNSRFEVSLATSKHQMVGIPIYIQIISREKYKLSIDAEKVKVKSVYGLETVKRLPSVKFEKILRFGKTYNFPDLSLAVSLNKDKALDIPQDKELFFVINDLKSLVRSFQRKLSMKSPAEDSYILELSTEGHTPAIEIDFLNSLMEVYIEQDLREKNKKGFLTVDFINKQLTSAEQKLIDSEQALAHFKATKSITNIATQSLNTSKALEELEARKSNLRIRLQNYQNIARLLKTAKKRSGFLPANSDINDVTLSNLLKDWTALHREKASLGQSATKDSPEMIRLHTQIKDLTISLDTYLNNSIEAVQVTLREINRRIAEFNERLTRYPVETQSLDDLERERDFHKNRYRFLQEKKSEAEISLATSTAESSIIDRAKVVGNGPISPNKKLSYFIAIFFSLAIPTGLVLVKEYLHIKIINTHDIENRINAPFLGVIPRTSKKIPVVSDYKSLAAEMFRALHLRITHSMPHKSTYVIGLLSTVHKEGKTFCAVNLAASFALANEKTIVVTVDLYKKQFDEYFDVSSEKGLTSYLKEEVGLDEVISSTSIQNLDVIPMGKILPDSSILLEAEENRLDTLFDELRERYKYIILDVAPTGYVSTYFKLSHYIDFSLYLMRYNHTKLSYLEEINKLIESNPRDNLFLVLNDAKLSSMYEYRFKAKSNKYIY